MSDQAAGIPNLLKAYKISMSASPGIFAARFLSSTGPSASKVRNAGLPRRRAATKNAKKLMSQHVACA
jgi:hypothetical protein